VTLPPCRPPSLHVPRSQRGQGAEGEEVGVGERGVTLWGGGGGNTILQAHERVVGLVLKQETERDAAEKGEAADESQVSARSEVEVSEVSLVTEGSLVTESIFLDLRKGGSGLFRYAAAHEDEHAKPPASTLSCATAATAKWEFDAEPPAAGKLVTAVATACVATSPHTHTNDPLIRTRMTPSYDAEPPAAELVAAVATACAAISPPCAHSSQVHPAVCFTLLVEKYKC
jgi:hypothetical protein